MREIIEYEWLILQLVIILSTIKNFTYSDNKKINIHIKKLIVLIVFFAVVIIVPKIIVGKGKNIVVIHIILLMITLLIDKQKKMKNLILFSTSYLLVCIIGLLFRNDYIIPRIFNSNSLNSKSELYYITFQSVFIALILGAKYVSEKAKEILKFIYRSNVRGCVIASIGFIIDFLLMSEIQKKLYWLSVVRIIIVFMVCVLLFFVVNYFAKIKFESIQVKELNDALEEKNNELRKIKHDYGAQISYLYGLHLLKRFSELECALTEICENNRAINSAVVIKNTDDSIIYESFKNALEDGIHVIINEEADLNKLEINQEELFVLLSKIQYILTNRMNGEGIIYIKSYEIIGNIIIKIENSELNYKKQHTFERGVVDKVLKLGNVNHNKSNEEEFVNIINTINTLGGKSYIKNGEDSTKIKIILPIKEF